MLVKFLDFGVVLPYNPHYVYTTLKRVANNPVCMVLFLLNCLFYLLCVIYPLLPNYCCMYYVSYNLLPYMNCFSNNYFSNNCFGTHCCSLLTCCYVDVCFISCLLRLSVYLNCVLSATYLSCCLLCVLILRVLCVLLTCGVIYMYSVYCCIVCLFFNILL